MKAVPQKQENESGIPSFSVLYQDYARTVRGVLYRLGTGAELDDLVQETFLRAWKARETFRGEASVKTWLCSIAVRAALNHFRKSKAKAESGVDPADLAFTDGGENKQVNQDIVRRGLARLSVGHRAVLVLHVLEGFVVSEIALLLDTSVGTVKSRLFYARKAMAKFLNEQGVAL